jgi:hypothetical protein
VTRYGAQSRTDRNRIPYPPISAISALGFGSTVLVAGHALINRVLPLWYEGSNANIGLEFVAHGAARHPAISFVGFSVLVATVTTHMTWGWAKWLGWTPAQVVQGGVEGLVRQKKRRYAINGVAAVTTILWLAGGLGVVVRGGETIGWQAKVYDEIYRKLPLVGRYY